MVNQASCLPLYLYYSLLKNTIMKKIFTLLVAVGFLTAAANAQSGSRDNRDKPQYDQRNTPQYDQRNVPQNGQRDNPQYDQRNTQQNGQWDKNNGYSNNNDSRYNNNNGSYGRGSEMQIAQINRKYDFQIQRVKNDFFMRRYEKMRMINSLEAQRQQEIRMLYARSGNNRDWQHDRGYNSYHH
jgi:hypothetical protein